ncbi:unnamed protein product [Rotaria socialis]|uniref:Uncharacterized protein n=1 Tax=Rotaria socialis TaxID=392032 RepID=A0A818C9Z8_9BILA|nr:unnamed protein product [Rotaria socialis]CAF3788323.1 unnamed protein product [Rotaria socialis]
MYHQLSSTSRLAQYESFTQSTQTEIFNVNSKDVITTNQKSRIQRWIFGMMIGSAPFFAVIMCWMFVSVCINNLVRYYQRRKRKHRHDARANGIKNIVSRINV